MGSSRKISRKGRLKRFLNRNPLKIERNNKSGVVHEQFIEKYGTKKTIKNNFDLDYVINEKLGMSFYECFNEDVLKECR